MDDGEKISLEPGIIGAEANARLAPYRRKIGPDPASINHCMIGGIAANNASGMCCGTAQNSYRTVESMKIIFHDGTLLDTADPESRALLRGVARGLVREIERHPGRDRAETAVLRERIRHKFRIKNTTGYSINAFVDYDGPRRHPPAPDDRLRRDAGVHRGDHVPDRGGARAQGLGPDPVPGHRERVPGDDHASRPARCPPSS